MHADAGKTPAPRVSTSDDGRLLVRTRAGEPARAVSVSAAEEDRLILGHAVPRAVNGGGNLARGSKGERSTPLPAATFNVACAG